MLFDNYDRAVAALGAFGIIYALAAPGSFVAQVILWATLAAVLGATIRFVMLVGELNVGTAAFYGVGAYTAAYLSTVYSVPFWAAAVAAGVLGGVVAAIFGAATMRTSGAYFMLISFAFAEIVRMVIVRSDALGGNNGIVGLFVPVELEPYFAALTVAVSLVMIGLLALLERSAFGKVMLAIRSREAVARAVGINVLLVRVVCLVAASVVTAVAGAFHAFTTHVITPTDFTFMLSVFALAYVKLGGEPHPAGPVVGAVILTVVSQYLLSFGSYQQLFFGVVIALSMLLLPNGLLGQLPGRRREVEEPSRRAS